MMQKVDVYEILGDLLGSILGSEIINKWVPKTKPNPPTLRVSVLEPPEVSLPPLPPLRPGPPWRRFSKNIVFL